LADRDLVIQDFAVILVPGKRLGCFPRGGRERASRFES
jgi:hypothetical protein